MTLSPLLIGTAGWSVPSRYATELPHGGSHLERYGQRLNAVEINSSFYRPHHRKTYERWAQSTPSGFRFSVKIPKAMTHEQHLAGCGVLLDHFAAEVAGLGDKLGALLVQLPPALALEKHHRLFDPRQRRKEFAHAHAHAGMVRLAHHEARRHQRHHAVRDVHADLLIGPVEHRRE